MPLLVRPAVSVIVTTYDFPSALSVSLSSLARQTDRNFEIVVADDGSDDRTRAVIAAAQAASPVPIHHVRQEHQGFRVARARNLAIRRSRGDYVIFLDGDCFVLPDFVALHRRLAKPGRFVSGKRSFLRPGITRRILGAGSAPAGGRLGWLRRTLTNQCTRPAEFLSLPDGAWRDRRPSDWQGVQTCNLGVWRRDIDKINGFDNRFVEHGLEDSDFVVRLIRSATYRRLGDHACLVLHLDHARRSQGGGSPNQGLFAATLAAGDYRTVDGLAQVPGSDAGILR